MIIKSIAISNIRSFTYDPTLSNEINFQNSGLNLIIGPNGSGKSNLVEILMRLFSDIYSTNASQYNDDLSRLIKVSMDKININSSRSIPGTFTKHRNFANKESSIKIKIILDKYDLANLRLIKKHSTVFDLIYKKNYQEINSTPFEHIFENATYTIPSNPTEYEIILKEDTWDTGRVFTETDQTSLAVRYLRDYSWVSTLIDIYNDLLIKDSFTQWDINQPTIYSYQTTLDSLGITHKAKPIARLKPPLLLMSVQERINNISLRYVYFDNNSGSEVRGNSKKYRALERTLAQKSTQGNMNTANSESFELMKSHIWEECIRLIQSPITTSQVVKEINTKDYMLKMFNSFIEPFRLKLKLNEFILKQDLISFTLKDAGAKIDVADMSTGQKAIINIAANLVIGNDLKATVLVDEIENHLHPSVQSKLRDALYSTDGFISQTIAITHSPVFITTKTLNATTRVYIEYGGTKTKNCRNALTRNAKSIINILDYTNGSRIFFTNKVLLVEGPSDQEFFTAYLKKFWPNSNIEVLSVGSKDQLQKWRKIIEDFEVKVCTIADLDAAKKDQIKTITPRVKGISIKWSDVDPIEYTTLKANISLGFAKHSFILKKGAIESYIPFSTKDKIEGMRHFLNKGDWTTLNHKIELSKIIKAVVKY